MTLRSCLFLILMMSPALAQNTPPLTGTPCLQTGNVAEYHPLEGRRSLVVIDKQNKQYRLDFAAVCESLQPHANLGFSTFNPSQYSCVSRGDSVYSSNDVGANRLCRIKTIEYFNEVPDSGPMIITGGHGRG
ncbi:MAG TPA: DUF6491 family protein [Rhizomicrobium sp.]|nr:DUF6491 family protein [Rhizomicrobium sp.]